jgi:L,D-transpeptidase ErfK/SrfK
VLGKRADRHRKWAQTAMTVILTGLTTVVLSWPICAQASVSPKIRLVINIPSYTLSLFEGEEIIKTYPVAVGKPSAQTPVGKFQILSKMVNPTWYPPDGSKMVLPGPENPLGRRWLGFLPNGYGIHGNNNSRSIGRAVSLGCVRMHNADVEELFAQIELGTELEIRYDTMEIISDPTTGRTVLVFYPDIYHLGPTNLTAMEMKLLESGLGAHFPRKQIETLISGTTTTPVYISLGMRVQAGAKELIVDTTIDRGETLIAARPLLEAFGFPIAWDSSQKAVLSKDAVLAATVKMGRSFVRLDDLTQQLNLNSSWYEPEQMLKLSIWCARLEEKPLGGAWVEDNEIWLSATALIEAGAVTGLTILAEEGVIRDGQGREWPGKLVGGEFYVCVNDLVEMMPVKASILEKEKRIEIAPVTLIDPS